MIGIPYQTGAIAVLTYDEADALLPYLDYSNAFFNYVDVPTQIRQGFEYLSLLLNRTLGRRTSVRQPRQRHPMRTHLDIGAFPIENNTCYIIGITQSLKSLLGSTPPLDWSLLDRHLPGRFQTPAGLILATELIPTLTRGYANQSQDTILPHTLTSSTLSLLLGYPWSSLFPTLFSIPVDLTTWDTTASTVLTALSTSGVSPTTLRRILALPEVSV